MEGHTIRNPPDTVMFFFPLLMTSAIAPPFELKDGDRVAWIGSTITEREQKYGYWETALLCQWPDRKITIRNLGWSGDTVEGIARAGFDMPAKGYERLVKAVKDQKPTVIFISYGSVEALEGWTPSRFGKGLQTLLDDLAEVKARTVLFTPTPLEGKNKEGNDRLAAFAQVIRDFHDREGYSTADLSFLLNNHQKKAEPGLNFTDNGLHFSEAGYESTIPDLFSSLNLSWAGVNPDKFEAVRKAVIKKNELFFHYWRPQNETYLFGFRKHEQGNNAKEVTEFEKLIENAEKEIQKLVSRSR